jgi:hypothetical protein
LDKFHVVTTDDDDAKQDWSPADLKRLRAAVDATRAILADPLALIQRAEALLLGTAVEII